MTDHPGTTALFAAVYSADTRAPEALTAVAREFSPRVEICGPQEVVVDVGGLTCLIGDASVIAAELHRTAATRGLQVHVAIAGTRTAARVWVHHLVASASPQERPSECPDPLHDVRVLDPGTEAEALAPLPLERLEIFASPMVDSPKPSLTKGWRRWGLRTLGDVAALPPAEVAARLGQAGVEWQRLARGEDDRPLVPAAPAERFEQALDLDWPIDGLEPLAFVLGRLLDPLSAHLERRDRGAAVVHVRLCLVTREVYVRSLQLPTPIRDARTLRTLILLDLESHPPTAAIDRVAIAIDPTPGRVVQFSLLTRPLPSPEQLSTLMARLQALMGDGRCGAAVAVDSWEAGAFAMTPFAPREAVSGSTEAETPLRASDTTSPAAMALRRFRHPIPARVRVERDAPVRVIADRRGWSGGRVETAAGPWHASGGWWFDHGPATSGGDSVYGWERDEWDVTLSDGATYRLFRDCRTHAWFIEGVVD